jgi:putative transposase
MRFAFVAKHRHIWPVSWLCEVLDVSRSGFHAWLNRPTSTREIQDAKLVTAIETSFKASDRTYGARRVWRDVLEEGLACGLHRIERLMRSNALRARPKRRGKPKDDGERSVIADNILDRDFQAERPNPRLNKSRKAHPASRSSSLATELREVRTCQPLSWDRPRLVRAPRARDRGTGRG